MPGFPIFFLTSCQVFSYFSSLHAKFPILLFTSCQVFPYSSSPHARFSHLLPHANFPVLFFTSCQFSHIIFHLMPVSPHFMPGFPIIFISRADLLQTAYSSSGLPAALGARGMTSAAFYWCALQLLFLLAL